MKVTTVDQLQSAGYLRKVRGIEIDGKNVSGYFPLHVIADLQTNPNFASGLLHGLHPEVGNDRTDFRSYRGTFGPGSLQIVIDKKTGRFHADTDEWNPYEDVVSYLGHAFGEVVPNFFKKLKRKVKK